MATLPVVAANSSKARCRVRRRQWMGNPLRCCLARRVDIAMPFERRQINQNQLAVPLLDQTLGG